MSYWHNPQGLTPKAYICGFCSNKVASSKGYIGSNNAVLYLCSNCDEPTYFFGLGGQLPDVAPGNSVQHLPADIESLYNEARNSVAASCYTGSVLICRKLLMNIGVQQGAETGKAFIFYIDYLAEKGFIPPNGRGWVDHIRKKGNEATHEIVLMSKEDCEDLIAFSEMLIKFIYEFPSKIPSTSA
ncbi:DUF4145 domain-containing protein [Shewanella sp. 1CM18E]|uniref:DUF4145 domain-containing protein n=1 Tax=Shewanella sp. 1CM18E TaxID=2929169 RepID=UPI0020BD628D|nr:DUF4145 domain-containing protein [Shewanella sp. 1CM18E]MCK8046952.1 DUF4145 domain-containing protein [Shewanella sp. 1CM18E]